MLAYASAGMALFSTIVIISNFGGLVSLIAALMTMIGAVGAVVFYKYGYMVVPWLTTRSNVVVVTDTGYEIPPNQDVIVKKAENGIYYASAFLSLGIHESALEMSSEQLHTYNQQFERAMASFKHVVKVAYMMYAVDISEQRKELEAKKAEAQLRLQREKEKAEPDILKIERYEREVSYYSNQLERISRGVRPMRVVLYAMTTAAGVTREEAISKARAQAQELRTLLENALNADVEILTADEMLRIFEWEKFLPASPEDFERELDLERRS